MTVVDSLFPVLQVASGVVHGSFRGSHAYFPHQTSTHQTDRRTTTSDFSHTRRPTMRNLISLTALTALSLLSASHAQSVRSATSSRINTATVQQAPIRMVLAGEGRSTLAGLEPVITEPSNQVIHPETSGTNCRWFVVGVAPLNSHWHLTTTFRYWDGQNWVLHCRDDYQMVQPVKMQLQLQDLFELP